MGLLDFLPWRRKTIDLSPAYVSIVKQARRPELYSDQHAPDSFDGRFDMLGAHVHLVLRRFRQDGVARDEIGQALFDMFFADMDQAMREAGVGDLGVGKHIRKMAQAFYGRAAAYDTAMGKAAPADQACLAPLAEVLARNLDPEGLRGQTGASEGIQQLATRLLQVEAHLAAKSVDDILAGNGFDGFDA